MLNLEIYKLENHNCKHVAIYQSVSMHNLPYLGTGKLHFVKFETSKVDECIAFIEAKGVQCGLPAQGRGEDPLSCVSACPARKATRH